MRKIKDRTGEIKVNKQGEYMTIVKYNRYTDITVQFKNSIGEVHTTYNHFKNGAVKNPYFKSALGVGFLGIGNHKASINKKLTRKYIVWRGMLDRCYNEKNIKQNISYTNCSVCEEWHNFQNFAKWYDNNYYKVKDERIELDKDILVKGNKIYSPKTCIFVPQSINGLFKIRARNRGEYPIGVYFVESKNKFVVNCQNTLINSSVHLGYFETSSEAFYAYKKYKENHIKKVADYYKDQIPNRLYKAMYGYEVEITD